jgi:hypothetical protein
LPKNQRGWDEATGRTFKTFPKGRKTGRFVTLADLALPPTQADLFRMIPDTEFRLDLSSTQLREKGATGSGAGVPLET